MKLRGVKIGINQTVRINYIPVCTNELYGPVRKVFEFLSFVGPKQHSPIFHRAHKTLDFQRQPPPPPLPHVIYLPTSKAIRTGTYKSQVHRWFYVTEARLIQGPYFMTLKTGSQSTANFTTLFPPPHTTYQKSTTNCKLHKGTLRYIKTVMSASVIYRAPKGHHHERSINVFSGLSTF